MHQLFVVFQHETDNKTYTQKTFIESFEFKEVAEKVSDCLQRELGYFTQFNEEKTFSVEEVFVNVMEDAEDVSSVVEEIEKRLKG